MANNTSELESSFACFKPPANNSGQRLLDQLADPISCIIILLCPVGLLTNILTITATLIKPRKQTVHFKFIVSLCLSDIVIVIGCCYHFGLEIFNGMTLFQYCFKKSIVDIGFLLTLSNLIAMAMDLYIGIMKPLKYDQIMMPFRGSCIVASIWMTSVLAGILDFFLTYHQLFEWQKINTGSTVLVLLLIIGLYTRICLEIKKMVLRNREQHEFHDNKAIATTSIIIVMFFLGWMPNALFNIYLLIRIGIEPDYIHDCETRKLLRQLALFCFIPMIANTICDPLIYAVRLKTVQEGYKEMFCKFLQKRPLSAANHFVSFYERRSTAVTIVSSNSSQEREMGTCCENKHMTTTNDKQVYEKDKQNISNDIMEESKLIQNVE